MAKITHADLDNRFNYHAPDAARAAAHGEAREILREAAVALVALIPAGREASLVVTHLEEAMFWANASLARDTG
jgi:hypothetical protein